VPEGVETGFKLGLEKDDTLLLAVVQKGSIAEGAGAGVNDPVELINGKNAAELQRDGLLHEELSQRPLHVELAARKILSKEGLVPLSLKKKKTIFYITSNSRYEMMADNMVDCGEIHGTNVMEWTDTQMHSGKTKKDAKCEEGIVLL